MEKETNLKKYKMKYIVYQTINLVNNNIYIGVHGCEDPDIFDGYIGCGVVITNPSSYNKPQTTFQYAVKKYGTSNFRRTILNIFDTSEEAYSLEKQIVNKAFIKRKDVYNEKEGGLCGSSYSVKINQFNKKGEFLKEWNSIVEAADFYNISHTSIHNAYKYKSCCKNFFWSKEKSINIDEYTYKTDSNPVICYQYNLSGKLVNTYNSIIEASKDNNATAPQIRRAIYGGYRVGDYYYSSKIYENYTGQLKVSLKKQPIYIYTLNGEFVTKLKNSEEIYNFFNIKSTGVVTTAIRNKKPYKEYQISLEKLDSMPEVINKRNMPKKVGRYSLTGDLLEMFDSATKACEKYGKVVQKALKGQQKQCKGFIFKYIS